MAPVVDFLRAQRIRERQQDKLQKNPASIEGSVFGECSTYYSSVSELSETKTRRFASIILLLLLKLSIYLYVIFIIIAKYYH